MDNATGVKAIYYKLRNSKRDGSPKRLSVLKMCGSSWSRSEFGVFVYRKIWLNAGWDVTGYMQTKYPGWWIFWWSKS